MVSECDTWIGLEHQQQYHLDLFQQVEVVVVPDAGHDMFYENPADSVAAVRAYLDS
jgi:pimeloyl-ACP methyl ester carboxylesterase